MTHIDIAQFQKVLRQNPQLPARRLRRQIIGGAIVLLLGGGYAFYHAGPRPAPLPASVSSPVTVQTMQPRTIEKRVPGAQKPHHHV